jgi:predicted nucleic acid-binding protein
MTPLWAVCWTGTALNKPMSVFLDANILFSASAKESNLYRFLKWLSDKETLVTSRYAEVEAERNIAAKRPQWREFDADIMNMVGIVPEAPLTIDAGLPDKDKPILGAAIGAGCAYLVTGDKRDFGHLYGKTVEGVTVLNYLDFAEIMLKKHA